MTTCVLCGDGQEYALCAICTGYVNTVMRGRLLRPEQVVDLPDVRDAAAKLKKMLR